MPSLVNCVELARQITSPQTSSELLHKLIPSAIAIAANGNKLVRVMLECDELIHKFVDPPAQRHDPMIDTMRKSVDDLRAEITRLSALLPPNERVIAVDLANDTLKDVS